MYALCVRQNRQKTKMSVPFYTVREDDSLGAKHGRKRWQYAHWKAKYVTKVVLKRNYRSMLHRLHTDEQYQESQYNLRCVEEYSRYLDDLAIAVMADFGQTYFGQSDFGQFFDRFWPIVGLTDFGQTEFGQF